MTRFDTLGLAEPILRAISSEGYSTPTPIQAQVIPAMIKGKDILGIAQTGTGKTASFVLPILNKISTEGKLPEPKSCGALILTPTRELASQIAENIKIYGRQVRPSVAIVVGGVSPRPQIKALSFGVDIVVATPGRLLDHLQTGAVSLKNTHTIVLDEADQMLDLGFVPAIKKIMSRLPSKKQTILMSATMPIAIRNLSKGFMHKPVEISVAAVSKPVERIKQSVIHLTKAEKGAVLRQILSDPKVSRAIIFTRTKRGADKVNLQLYKAGFSSSAIHGNKSQGQRDNALKAFKSGKSPILVATDIAARGIDIDDVSHVLNYDLPNIAEAYVHRIGRTARAGREGIAISFCDPSEKAYLRDIEKLIGNKLELQVPEESSYDPVKLDPPIKLDMEKPKAETKSRPPRRRNKNTQGRKTEGAGAGSGSANGKRTAGSSKPNSSNNNRNRKRPAQKPNQRRRQRAATA
ncbi:MAG: DEAD/DEAH box helicase [Methyloligellaceae bacterium]